MSELPPTTTSSTQHHHATVLLAHCVFKVLPVLAYVFCGWFNDEFVLNFVCIVLILAVDFWICKNVSGRLLVGLRYWNEIDENGESKWLFESRDEEGMKNLVDANEQRIFWFTVYCAPLVWFVFLGVALTKLNFDYALVCLMALGMLGSNAIGYMKCSKDQQKHISGVARRGAVSFLTGGYL